MRCAATCDSGAGERGHKERGPETLSQVLDQAGLFAHINYLQMVTKSQAPRFYQFVVLSRNGRFVAVVDVIVMSPRAPTV